MYLICSDIDGTLMTSEQTISKQTLELIHQMQQAGHLFFVATGRMYLSALKIAEDIGEHTGVIASNGGVFSLNDEMTTYPMSLESAMQIYKIAMECDLPLFFFSTDTIYYSSILPSYFQNKTDQGRVDAGKQESYHQIKDIHELKEYGHTFVSGIIISEESGKLKEAKEKLQLMNDLSISSSFWNNIEIMPRGISKAKAIQALQEHYHIDKEHTITFGDGGNDIDMFSVSSMSVAMDNASDDVKAKANYITASNNDDGVYQFLKKVMEDNQNGK